MNIAYLGDTSQSGGLQVPLKQKTGPEKGEIVPATFTGFYYVYKKGCNKRLIKNYILKVLRIAKIKIYIFNVPLKKFECNQS